MRLLEWMLFLRTWLRNPRRVGALAPSSPALAALMTTQISHDDASVIELGAGTGVFTRALLARGVGSDRLVLVEADPAFAGALRRQFPTLRVMQMDAAELGLTGSFFGAERAHAIVSGLPLVAMPVEQAVAIVQGAFAHHLAAGGAFYQFTYAPRCPIPRRQLEAIGIRAARVGIAWMNFPPAVVYRFERRVEGAADPWPGTWQQTASSQGRPLSAGAVRVRTERRELPAAPTADGATAARGR
ncbi:class I SAM-dependent methyltransferase [Burkholderia sp. MR1-5-21]